MGCDPDPYPADLLADGLAIGLVQISDGEPPALEIGNRLLNEPGVSNDPFVPPEVGTGDVAKRQPKTGVHRGVVGGVPPFDGREGPSDLNTLRRADVCEVGAFDRGVVPDIGTEVRAVDPDEKARMIPLERHTRVGKGTAAEQKTCNCDDAYSSAVQLGDVGGRSCRSPFFWDTDLLAGRSQRLQFAMKSPAYFSHDDRSSVALPFLVHVDLEGRPRDDTRSDPQVETSPVRGFVVLLAVFLLFPLASPADDRILDWVKVTDKAGWQARDSSGEVAYKDRLWLLGGWFDSFSAPPRDVWSSPDGKTWNRAAALAPWKHSDLPMTVVFNDRMWLMGGWFNGRLPDHSASNEVWSSSDGMSWERATDHAGWSPRLAAGAVAFNGAVGPGRHRKLLLRRHLKSQKRRLVVCRRQELAARGHQCPLVASGLSCGRRARRQGLGVGRWQLRSAIPGPERRLELVRRHSLETDHGARPLGPQDLVLRGGLPRSDVDPRRLVEQPLEKLGRRLAFTGRKSMDEAPVECGLEGAHEHSTYVLNDRIYVAGGHAQPLSMEVWSLHVPRDWFAVAP